MLPFNEAASEAADGASRDDPLEEAVPAKNDSVFAAQGSAPEELDRSS